MRKDSGNWTKRYLLRHLAGRYFLIRRGTDLPEYKRPLETDETGAMFWRAICRYPDDPGEAARVLSEPCNVPAEELLPDVEEFCRTVKQMMGEAL